MCEPDAETPRRVVMHDDRIGETAHGVQWLIVVVAAPANIVPVGYQVDTIRSAHKEASACCEALLVELHLQEEGHGRGLSDRRHDRSCLPPNPRFARRPQTCQACPPSPQVLWSSLWSICEKV